MKGQAGVILRKCNQEGQRGASIQDYTSDSELKGADTSSRWLRGSGSPWVLRGMPGRLSQRHAGWHAPVKRMRSVLSRAVCVCLARTPWPPWDRDPGGESSEHRPQVDHGLRWQQPHHRLRHRVQEQVRWGTISVIPLAAHSPLVCVAKGTS